MPKEIGFTNTIRVGGRKLQVRTQFEEATQRVHTSIFDGEQLIDTREHFIEEETPKESFDAEVKQLHGLVISDLELLFHVSDKVKATKNTAALLKLGTLLLEKGFVDEAITTFEKLIDIDPNYKDVYLYLGKAYYRKGDYEAAEQNLSRASQRDPNYPDVHALLAEVYRKMKKPLKAIEELEKALALNNDYIRAHLLLGLVLAESTLSMPTHSELPPPIQRLKDSKKHLQYVLTQMSEPQRNHLLLGIERLDSKEEFEQGLQEIEMTIDAEAYNHRSMVADSEFYLKFIFADIAHNQKTLDNYIKILEKTVASHPDYADVWQSLGTAYLLRGWHNFAKALESYREAVKINPQYKKAKTNMRLLENEGRGFLILLRSILK